jgi:hypothetical protein
MSCGALTGNAIEQRSAFSCRMENEELFMNQYTKKLAGMYRQIKINQTQKLLKFLGFLNEKHQDATRSLQCKCRLEIRAADLFSFVHGIVNQISQNKYTCPHFHSFAALLKH